MTTAVNGERVKQAREIRGLTQSELAQAVGIDQSHVSLLEQNARSASDALLEKIGLVTQFPSAFFRQEGGPEFPYGSLLYRRQRGLSGQDAARLRQAARLALEVMLRLERRFKPLPLRVPSAGAEPIVAAKIARSELGLSPDTPVTNLVNKLEKSGVYVFRLPCEIDQYDGFSAWSNDDSPRPIIALGLNKSGERQRFTVAHELAHLVMHRSFLGYPGELDRQANIFAAEFLAPEEAMRNEMEPPLTLTRLAEIKAKWGVSIEALIERAAFLEIINPRQKKYLRTKFVSAGWWRNEPAPIPLERPRLLVQMLETAYGAPVDLAKVAQLVKTSPRMIAELITAAKEAGDVPGVERSSPAKPIRDTGSTAGAAVTPSGEDERPRASVLTFRR